jgi:hypothetical protein
MFIIIQRIQKFQIFEFCIRYLKSRHARMTEKWPERDSTYGP